MEKPKLMTKPALTYSKEAMAMKQGGLALVSCVINLDGSLADCKITKSVPYMDQQILEMLKSWRYTPVIFEGRARSVRMTIPVRVPAPA